MTFHSITENPFVYGLKHTSYRETEIKFSPDFIKGLPIGKMADTAYFAGRIVRFGVSFVGAVIDVALQFFQCVLITPVIFLVKAESFMRRCHYDKAYSHYLSYPFSVVQRIRDYTTHNQFKSFAKDIESIAECFTKTDFREMYTQFMVEKILK